MRAASLRSASGCVRTSQREAAQRLVVVARLDAGLGEPQRRVVGEGALRAARHELPQGGAARLGIAGQGAQRRVVGLLVLGRRRRRPRLAGGEREPRGDERGPPQSNRSRSLSRKPFVTGDTSSPESSAKRSRRRRCSSLSLVGTSTKMRT